MVLWVPAFESLYGKFDQQIGHYRRYRRNQLLALVHNVGFQQVSARYTNMPGFFAWWLVVRVLGRAPTSGRLAVDLRPLLHPGHPPRRAFRATARSVSRCWLSPSGRRWRSPLRRHRRRAADGSISPREHIAALDGLRGLAVVAVLFFHAGKLQGGFLGVDLFFALSGFLITSLLLAEVDLIGRVRLVAFWGRRFRRLLPAVLLLLVAVTVITTARGERARARRNAQRRAVGAGLRRQLARHRRAPRLLGIVRAAADVRPPVEPGDRGAVLPRVARRGRADRLAQPSRAPHGHRRLHRGLGRSRCCG